MGADELAAADEAYRKFEAAWLKRYTFNRNVGPFSLAAKKVLADVLAAEHAAGREAERASWREACDAITARRGVRP